MQLRYCKQSLAIAWWQLRHQKAQTLAAIVGIAFTTVLLFMQIGFRSSFIGSLVQFPKSFDCDIFIVSASSVTVLRPLPFSERRLYQVLGVEGVESVSPTYINSFLWRDPRDRSLFLRQVMGIGFPLNSRFFEAPGVADNLDKLKLNKSVLIDERSRPEFAPIIDLFRQQGKTIEEIKTSSQGGLHRIKVVGLFELGTSTSFDASIVMSKSTFLSLFDRHPSQIDWGLVRVKPGYDVDEVTERIREYLPNDVRAFSKADVLNKERNFYEYRTPLGLIFRFGLLASVVVGIIILYQILYVKIAQSIQEYATLKAMGYSQQALTLVVIGEASILAVSGYIPGFLASCWMYEFLETATQMIFVMRLDVAIAVLVSISFICFVSGGLAVGKLKEADPADIFG